METTLETIENNKLIAEFMGYSTDKVEVTIPKFKRLIAFNTQSIKETSIKCFESSIFKFNELEFHSSWEWLMTVVEEIEQNKKYFKKELQLNITKYSVCWQTIDNEAVILSPNVFRKYATYAGFEKLQAVYKSVIDFITWHNKNKQNH